MKKLTCLLLAICMVFTLAACGGAAAQPEVAEWTREGYYTNEDENMLSVTWMDLDNTSGWYAGFLNGEDWVEDSYGGMVQQDGNSLRGVLSSSGAKGDLSVSISEEGEDGLVLTVEGGGTYHFTPMDMPDATIFVHINVDGWGNIAYAEGEATPEIDPDYPFQSAQINLAEPATHTFLAWPKTGNLFVKWTKDGEDFSTQPQITVLLDESADFVAVFADDPDWQNPIMNFVGEYQCDRARAKVECFGKEDAWISIEWADSAWEMTNWVISEALDTDTLTVEYPGCVKTNFVYDDNGEVKSDDSEYEEIPGSIVFNDDGSFTWHRDLPEGGQDLVFERLPAAEN